MLRELPYMNASLSIERNINLEKISSRAMHFNKNKKFCSKEFKKKS